MYRKGPRQLSFLSFMTSTFSLLKVAKGFSHKFTASRPPCSLACSRLQHSSAKRSWKLTRKTHGGWGFFPPPPPPSPSFPDHSRPSFPWLVFGPYYLGAWHRLPSRRLSTLLILLFSYGVPPGALSCLPFPLHHQTEPWLQLLLLLPKTKKKKGALRTIIFGYFSFSLKDKIERFTMIYSRLSNEPFR